MNLPANAGDYTVVNSTGQPVIGINLQLLSRSATATVFDVTVASSISPGQYRFVAGTASAPFDILASQAPDITSLDPGQILPGATTPVVRGVNLPISPLPYLVVNSADQRIKWRTRSTGPINRWRRSWLTHRRRPHDFRHFFIMSCTKRLEYGRGIRVPSKRWRTFVRD